MVITAGVVLKKEFPNIVFVARANDSGGAGGRYHCG